MSFGKVIVLTGASSGIGAALAEHLGAQGNRLALAARREKELQEVAARSGPEALAVTTDVSKRSDVENLRDRALAAFGQVDVWINNAGRGIGKPTLELTDEDFDEMMAVNTKSALYGMQAIVPHFQSRRAGHLVNVSSFLGRVPIASVRSAYNAAKAALNSLTANLRMDLQQEYPGIHVSLVMPGVVLTEFAKNALGGAPAGPPPSSPMRPQSVEEVVAAIANLLEHPVPEIYTNPASADIVRRYYEDIGAFEAGFAPPPTPPKAPA
jgi:NADP-dependent 3-hydroxy acid dehydrogenase YdfG